MIPDHGAQILTQQAKIKQASGQDVSLRLAAMVLAINKVGTVSVGQGSLMSG